MTRKTLKDLTAATLISASFIGGGWLAGGAIGKAIAYPVNDFKPATAANAANAQVKGSLMQHSYTHGHRRPLSVRCHGMRGEFWRGTRVCMVRYQGLGRLVAIGVRFHEDASIRHMIV